MSIVCENCGAKLYVVYSDLRHLRPPDDEAAKIEPFEGSNSTVQYYQKR